MNRAFGIRSQQVVLALFVAAACVSAAQGIANAVFRPEGSQDFQWSPARTLLDHRDPYAEQLALGHAAFLQQAANYPVFGLQLLAPIAALDWPLAKLAWVAVNLGLTALILTAVLRLLPGLPARTKLMLACAFVASTPWRNGVGNGQQALLSLAAFLGAVVLLPPRSALARALLLAVSWVKYSIGLPMTLMWARPRAHWRVPVVAAAIHAVAIALACLWVSASAWDIATGPLRVASITTGTGHLDVFAIAARAGVPKPYAIAAAAAIAVAATIVLRRCGDTLGALAIACFAALAVAFHLPYDYVLLLLPLALALRSGNSVSSTLSIALVAAVWFGEKLVTVVVAASPAAASLRNSWYWLEAALFYSSFAACGWRMLQQDSTLASTP